VALSGAGPSVLLITDASHPAEDIVEKIRRAAGDTTLEVLETSIAQGVTAAPITI
jgi:homoserine kinase